MIQISSDSGFGQQTGPQPAKPSVERLLAEARVRLVETGTRNRLVHTPRDAKRRRSLSISGANSDGLLQVLVRAGRSMRFLPAVKTDLLAQASSNEAHTLLETVSPTVSLQTNLEPEALEKRLLAIYRDAKAVEDEQGINVLFLALGFLRWYEDEKSDVRREAPLVLIPVSLKRDPRRSTFELAVRDEDMAANQAIQERLRADFGIALPDLPENEEWRPSEYFATINDAISARTRWSIDPNGVELGFYSFSKLLMIRDLDPAVWTESAILDHPLLRGLLAEGFKEESAAVPADAELDKLFQPADLIQVVDADSSQTIVIENVRAGRNLVVQGPPGTGKSQTITNIIASAVHDGKTVLFVAEKMAALSVVHDRLRRVGLGPVCLELHSRASNKRQVLAELEETLNQSPLAADPNDGSKLAKIRAMLNAFAERMHTPIGDTGLTPFRALSQLALAKQVGTVSNPALLKEVAVWPADKYAAGVDAAMRLGEITANSGPCFKHPYFGIRGTHLQPAEIERLSPSLSKLAEAAIELADRAENIGDFLGVGQEPSLGSSVQLVSVLRTVASLPAAAADILHIVAIQQPARIQEVALLGVTLNQLKSAHTETFVDDAWSAPAVSLKRSLASGLSLFGRWKSDYRRGSKLLASLARAPLPKKVEARIELVEKLVAIEKAREALKAEDAAMCAMIPTFWRSERTDFATLHSASAVLLSLASYSPQPRIDSVAEIARQSLAKPYLEALTASIEALMHAAEAVFPALDIDVVKTFGAEGYGRIPLRSLAEKARLWRDSQPRFDEWRRLASADAHLRALSATALADALATGAVAPGAAKAVLDCTFAEAVWSTAVRTMPELQEFYGPEHDALIDEFRTLEAKRRDTTVQIIRERHLAKALRGDFGAMNTIRSEIKRRRGNMPIRKLFKTAGKTLQQIKPVLLMSPISVAQFLPPESIEFDLLVIDEASQVRPEDALGLVARAKQIVVVGDSKQLPPTSFFDRVVADEEEEQDEADDEAGGLLQGAAKATDLESILALCEARGLNSAMLRWHYRSRHPSLIAVSNAEFYKRLVMPPAPAAGRDGVGLILRRVAGAYDRGGKRVNVIEAEAVVDAVAKHASASPNLSLGVVTFSTAQRDTISDLLDFKRRADDALDAFLREGATEDVFVKNLENVQGDERDVIFVSVGYGPRIAGARLDSMAFGPVSAEGGERRLNVLFTRARSRCEIFASFASGDIDLDRAKGEGPRILKRFMQYAETGILEERHPTNGDADSPFEEAVAAVIEKWDHKVDKQVGSAGFKIDLAVRDKEHPGRYLLAVECDGATYHSALWARERDRLRQEVLENMGWRFHRIWSTDWFYRRDEAIAKLRAALESAQAVASANASPGCPNRH